MKNILKLLLFVAICFSANAQTLKSIMESNKFIMAPVNFWTQQPYSGPFSNAVNAVVLHPETGGNVFNTTQFSTNGGIVTILTNVFPTFGQFDTNYFTTNSSIVSLNTNPSSGTYYLITNLVNVVVGGSSLWFTNVLPPEVAATGGMTNLYAPVSVLNGNFYVGNELVKLDDNGSAWFAGSALQISTDGSITGTGNGSINAGGGLKIENTPSVSGPAGARASFGHGNIFSSNIFQIVINTNGIPSFEIGQDTIMRLNEDLVVRDVQTNLNLSGTGMRFVLVDDNGRLRSGFATNGFTTNVVSVTPGGSDGNIQYNDGGAFGGDAKFVWNDTNEEVTIGPTGPESIVLAAAGNASFGGGDISLQADGDADFVGAVTAFSLIATEDLTVGGGDFTVANNGTTTLNDGNFSVHFGGAMYGNGAGITNIIFSGTGVPAITPAAARAIYINETDGVTFHWWGGAWH